MLNIHPSLLPLFPGLATHAQALAAGVQEHGATVHFVTAELDHGPMVLQAPCLCCRMIRSKPCRRRAGTGTCHLSARRALVQKTG
jgi:folate-dependent phosphoribosylglycinamide formyltransferase PurN